jgi:hypothetical protein
VRRVVSADERLKDATLPDTPGAEISAGL